MKGHGAHSHKNWGKSPCDPPKGANMCLFCHATNVVFQTLILHRFWPFLKQKTWIGVRMCTVMKNFRISVQGFYRPQKQLKGDNFEGVFVIVVQLKWHNVGWWELFQGLVDISMMCLLYMNFGGHTVLALWVPKNPNFGSRCCRLHSVSDVFTVHVSTSLAKGQYALFEPI